MKSHSINALMLKTYPVTTSRTLIDHLVNLGRGISYDRVLSITKNIYESLRESFLTYNFFFPNVLKKGLFTVLIKDNQIPVDVSDQPVFALTKELQFRFPIIFLGYLPFVGGLHIEQSLLSLYGELIKETGLLEILSQHNFSTFARVDLIFDRYFEDRSQRSDTRQERSGIEVPFLMVIPHCQRPWAN